VIQIGGSARVGRTDLQRWMVERDREDDRLYERYGRPLEAEHAGEFVAISARGELILGADELSVARQAVERFGPGTFALRRIGAEAEIRWRRQA
jgi:hypothetical protein